MTTRRRAILGALTLLPPLRLLAAKNFWDDKPSSNWTPSEIDQLLTKSPWSKEASISYDSGQRGPIGGAPRSSSASVGSRRGGVRGSGGAGAAGGRTIGPGPAGPWKAVVRWESALPIREALHKQSSEESDENYILNVVGDIPALGVPSDSDDPTERKFKLDRLRESTRIERRDDPLTLQKAVETKDGTLFYFSRVFAIKPTDTSVTFVTKIGPLELRSKFQLRDMLYHTKLEL